MRLQRFAFPDQNNLGQINLGYINPLVLRLRPAASSSAPLQLLNPVRMVGASFMLTLVSVAYLFTVNRVDLNPSEEWSWFVCMLTLPVCFAANATSQDRLSQFPVRKGWVLLLFMGKVKVLSPVMLAVLWVLVPRWSEQ